MSDPGLLIFDMDGVLVDVSESYREAIRRTVEHFTGAAITSELIQDFKNQGGWNDDWALSYHLIRDAEVEVGFDTVVDHFQKLFRGATGNDGLILREKWIARPDLFPRLAKRYTFAVFTGRLQEEAQVTLQRFAPELFYPVIGADDVHATKPSPEGILKIRAAIPHSAAFYLGDTIDDALSAEAANVPFIGVVGSTTPNRAAAVQVLTDHAAIAVLESINELEELLQPADSAIMTHPS